MIAFAAGLLLFHIGPRLPHWAIAVFLLGGSIMITIAVLWDGHGIEPPTAPAPATRTTAAAASAGSGP